MLAPLHLRLANLRRFLDARIPADGGAFRNINDHKKLMDMIRQQSIPVFIRSTSNNKFDAVVMEKALQTFIPSDKKAETVDWYVLNDGDFDSVEEARKWISTFCWYYIPEFLG